MVTPKNFFMTACLLIGVLLAYLVLPVSFTAPGQVFVFLLVVAMLAFTLYVILKFLIYLLTGYRFGDAVPVYVDDGIDLS